MTDVIAFVLSVSLLIVSLLMPVLLFVVAPVIAWDWLERRAKDREQRRERK